MKKKIISIFLIILILFGLFNVSTFADIKQIEYNFDYTGNIQSFTVPYSGKYKIETYGAQGGTSNRPGGLGGYSSVEISLLKDTNLFVTVGGVGGSGKEQNEEGLNINGDNFTSKVNGTMKTQSILFGDEANLFANTYSRIGYSFINWNTKKDGSGTNFEDQQLV